MSGKLERLVYRSVPVRSFARVSAVDDIFAVAARRNAEDQLTAALVVSPDRFVQVLEGPGARIADLLGRLHADPRHRNIEVIAHLPVTDRLFAGQPLARADLDGAPPLIAQAVVQTGAGLQVPKLVLDLVMLAARRPV